MKNGYFIIPIIGFIITGCAPMQSSNGPSLEERIAMQDRQLRQMQPQQADTWNEVQAMRQEINDLKGQLEDLKNVGGARGLADRVRQHDVALRQVDDNMSLNLNLGDPVPPQNGAEAQIPPSVQLPANHAPDSSAYGASGVALTPPAAAATAMQSAEPQTGSYGLPPDPAPLQQQPGAAQTASASEPLIAPSESTWGQADPQPAPEAAVPKKDISLALFDAGVNAYNARNYTEAARSFSDFLKNYKGHTQSAEAQYYLADCDFQRNNFPQAALAYDEVIKKYPKSSSAPKAYLKQAISFGKMNQKDAAKARMQELIKKYPNAPEVARAKSYLKNNK